MTDKEQKLNEILENINAIMWQSFWINGYSFGRAEGFKIAAELNKWAELCDQTESGNKS